MEKRVSIFKKVCIFLMICGCIGGVAIILYSRYVREIMYGDSIVFGIVAVVALLRVIGAEKEERKKLGIVIVAGGINLLACIMSIIL